MTFGQKKGDKLFNESAFEKAAFKYEKHLKKDSNSLEVMYKLAVCYTHLNSHEKAVGYYNKVISNKRSKLLNDYDWNEIGQFYLKQGKQQEAQIAFRYLVDSNNYFNSQEIAVKRKTYKTVNLENINTKFSEFSPFIINNEFVFTSDRSYSLYGNAGANDGEKSYLSIFTVVVDSVILNKKIKRFSGKINSGFENGTVCFSKDGKRLFFTKSSPVENGVSHSEIYTSELINDKWTKTVSISLNNESYSVAHPVYIDDLNMLVFASNMPGGIGGMDLYYSYFKDNLWSTPVNFGPKVNTQFNEVFPSRNSTKSDEIYFSSNGRFGYGGMDVYRMIFRNENVVRVNVLPETLNSKEDDFGIFFSTDSTGFVSSNRSGGKGGDDIYSFTIDSKPMPLIEVKQFEFSGSIFDEETGLPIVDHKMYLLSVDNRVIDSTLTDIEGVFKFKKPPRMDVVILPGESEEREVSVKVRSTASKDNANGVLYVMSSRKVIEDSVYLAEGEVLTFYMESNDAENKYKCVVYEDGKKAVKIVYVMKDSSGLVLDSADQASACLTIRKIYPEKEIITLLDDEDVRFSFNSIDKLEITKEKDTVIVERIYFEVERVVITEESKSPLTKIIKVLEDNPDANIKITGHTDSRGDENYNLRLSEKRADAIMKYLISEGIKKERLSSEGYGETRIVNHCKNDVKCSDEEHGQNRRTEFEITWD